MCAALLGAVRSWKVLPQPAGPRWSSTVVFFFWVDHPESSIFWVLFNSWPAGVALSSDPVEEVCPDVTGNRGVTFDYAYVSTSEVNTRRDPGLFSSVVTAVRCPVTRAPPPERRKAGCPRPAFPPPPTITRPIGVGAHGDQLAASGSLFGRPCWARSDGESRLGRGRPLGRQDAALAPQESENAPWALSYGRRPRTPNSGPSPDRRRTQSSGTG